jgi:alkyldihydroxyacetonephosphate synthase
MRSTVWSRRSWVMRASETKWWGWGDAAKRLQLGSGAIRMLGDRLGEAEPSPPVALEQVRLPPPAPLPEAVVRAVGAENVLDGDEDRLRHATGMSYPDLIRLRHGLIENAPDAVILPDDDEQVARAIEACSREGVAVVPFGGGTSVVGGVDPVRGGFERVIALDLGRLRAVAVDRRSLSARLGAGLPGPAAERALGEHGVTLGHFPQSFEYATIGGYAATRSAGQASSGYGRFDDQVTGLRLVAPVGELRTAETPHSAAGPSLRQLVVGSEGVLGVITEVTARVRPAPESRRYEAWMASGFEAGGEIVRELAQRDELPDVVRLSDREETRVSLGLSGPEGVAALALDSYLRVRRRADGCILLVGWEGDREAVARRRALAGRRLRSGGAVMLGGRGGRAWQRGRFEGPYLRDALLDLGYMVETLETAHTWSRLGELYEAVRQAIDAALEGQGTPGLAFCHVSHAYPDGASLYFTFIARRRPGEEIEQWRSVKIAACEAIVRAGGTITHHHAVGRDHAPYMPAEVGELGLDALRAVKQRLDPAGIMNPGKLLPGPAS